MITNIGYQVHFIKLPDDVRSCVTLNEDDTYSIFIDDRLSCAQQWIAFVHEMKHILRGDFSSDRTADELEIGGMIKRSTAWSIEETF